MNLRQYLNLKTLYTILIALPIGLPLSTSAQSPSKQWHIDEVGWTLRLPPGNKLDRTELDSLFDATRARIKPSELDTRGLQVLFAFLLPPYNAFGATLARYDTSLYPDWAVFHAYTINHVLETFAAQAPKMRVLDTASSIETIDGVAFQRLYIKTYFPNKQLTAYNWWFACRRRGYDFSINISYADEATGQQFLDILRHSTFDQ